MGKIFCIMGKSSSGKDSIFKMLVASKYLGLNPIVPYTTRPQRVDEQNGVDYYFIKEDKLFEFEKEGKIIEKRQYDTVKGLWYYCTVDDGQIDLNNSNYTLIVTLEAFNNLRKYFGSDNIIPIYIEVEDGVRLERALCREKRQAKPNYDELCRRFLADNNDFSLEKLVKSNIIRHYHNGDLNECVQKIKADIMEIIDS